jgi:hypothetical protein
MKSQLKHLLGLLDDPDTTVAPIVCQEILKFGPQVIPFLTEYALNNPNETIFNNTKFIVCELNLRSCIGYYDEWQNSKTQSLIDGALVVAKFHNPDLDEIDFNLSFCELRKQAKIAAATAKTSVEKASALTQLFFKTNRFKAANNNLIPNEYLVDLVMDSRFGNTQILSIFLQTLAADLGLPLKQVYLPNKTLLAVLKPAEQRIICQTALDEIDFFYDPENGLIYSKKDVIRFLDKVGITITNDFFTVINNKTIINELIETYCQFLTKEDDSHQYEILNLKSLLKR